MKQSGKFYVYIIQCADNSFYTGYTNNLDRRISQHKKGKGARYVRSRLPIRAHFYYESFQNRGSAMKREIEIKKMSRKDKRELFSKIIDRA